MRRILLIGCMIFMLTRMSAQTVQHHATGWSRTSHTLTLRTESPSVRFIFFTSEIVRVDWLPSQQTKMDSSFVVVRDTTATVPVSIEESDSMLVVASSALRIECRKHPLHLTVRDAATGRLMLDEAREGGYEAIKNSRTVRFALQPTDHFYGTGERGTSLDKRGLAFDSYNTQTGGYATPLGTMNINIPFIATTSGYALLFDNTYKAHWDLGASSASTFSYTTSGGEMSYYIIAGRTIPEQLERYTWLTGRQPLPPRWALGFIQSKNRYESEAEARAIVDTLRAKDFPCDGLVLDLRWFARMGDLSWNEKSWPHHEQMVQDFLSRGIKTILITEPYIIEPSINFKEAASKGYLGTDAHGRPYMLDNWWSCGGCNASLLDMTNPEARAWWWSKHPAFMGAQVAGLWTDLGEPERHPLDMHHRMGSTEKIHNIYDLLWAQTLFEGFSRMRPNERMFNLTRSGYAGIQRYGVLPWSGDVSRSFGGLAVQLPMLLNMGMSGLAYQHSDMGGYARVPTTPELYIRWTEYGTFSPLARAHGAGEVVNGSPTEPWRFGAEAERICRDYLRLRYRLLPYLYTMAHENSQTGMPLARPLFMLDPGDTTLVNESSAYGWGPAFVVAPVVEAGAVTKDVRLPSGRWINFWTDESLDGGATRRVDAPLDRMPLFVKSGSIIPMASVMAYSDEHPLDTLTLECYPPQSGRSSYTLYEDDGRTLGYQHGESATTKFTQSIDHKQAHTSWYFTIGESKGEYAGKLQRRTFIIVIHGVAAEPSIVHADGRSLSMRKSIKALRARGEGYRYDAGSKIVEIQLTRETYTPTVVDVENIQLMP